ncbi:hypothetical protein F7734_26855 [Scytonema sp. UIC 10036]|uniref:cadherin domain-containing protein n=1 Tax=Scytonema sp. UIC 10036 TaxID=2304196 RepID=UPI0012DA620E|nr:cadherin domain-containing protein [Scytonema sp. UIC 10036]MUG95780.1 hypothetical protein [Scytonema sp. UIC 10036]
MNLKLTNFDAPNQSSDPSNIINVNGTIYFTASDSTYGTELWKLYSNGIPIRVFDLFPGSTPSKPSNLTIFNGTLYFTASDSTSGSQLWKIDSNGSPIRVGGSHPSAYNFGSNPANLTVINNTLYFTASDPNYGTELWAMNSGGAIARISDIYFGTGSSNPSNLINVNGTLYFIAADSTSNRKLWKLDNIRGIPVLVSNDFYFNNNSPTPNLTNINGTLYFTATNNGLGTELWKIDSNGTPICIKDIYAGFQSSNPSNLTNVNGTLYFTANDGASGVELWKLDSNGVPTLVSDIFPGGASSNPSNLTNVNGTLYFTVTDSTYGSQLWTIGSNGTPVRLTNIYASYNTPPISNLTNVNGTLFFTAHDGSGSELWKLNSNNIPLRVSDIFSGSGSSNPSNLTVINDTLYFSANDGILGTELWKLNTTGTPTLVGDINKKGLQPPANLTNVNGTLYFTADDKSSGRELWKIDSNGTPVRVADLYPGSASSFVSNLKVVNGTLYFTATNGQSGIELWKIDSNGFPALVKDINPNGSSDPGNLVDVNGTLYFSAYDSTYGSELWKLDSNGHPVRVSDINPGSGSSVSSSQNRYLTNVNGTLYFTAYEPTYGWELWKLNSEGIPVRLSDIVPGNTVSNSPSDLINVNGTLYFTAYDQTTGRELWKLDSNDTPVSVQDIYPGINGSNPSNLTNFNGSLYFTAYEPTYGDELWKIGSDGTAMRVSDLYSGSSGSYPGNLTVVNDTLYFTAVSSGSNRELWKLDSNDIPLRVSNFTANSRYSSLSNLTNVNGTLYFNINDPTYGTELWKLDSNETPVRMTDIDPSLGSSNPSNLTYIDGKLYFVADNGSDGSEIWSLDTHSSSTTPSENTAPTLTNTYVTLNSVNEDAGAPSGAVGTLVSSIVSFGKNVNDLDSDSENGAVTGIAIASANTTYGSWYYTTNNGTNWNPLGELSGSTARLLAADANTRIDFRPNSNYNGTINNALIFHAWDRTTGINGGTASTTSVGGSTALSYATSTASIFVSSVNDAPTIAPNQSFNIPKNATSGTVIGTVAATDVDGNSTLSQWKIAGGNIDLNGNGISAFSINSNTGQIVINDINDLKPSTYPRINLQVNVSDGFTTSANETVTVKLLNPGDPDPSFGMGGKVFTNLGNIDSANSVAIQSDGKIVVAGSNGDFALARYNTNGTLDSSFGAGGKVVTDFNGSTDHGNSVAIQSDGKIIVAGVAWSNSQTDFALARYNTNGTLDTSFGNGGKVITPIGSLGDWGNCVTIQADGKIIVGGHTSLNSSSSDLDFALVRYNPNGSLDTSFGNGGKVVTSITLGQDSISSIVIQPDNKIVVGGSAAGKFALSRYNLNGTLDTSFGVSGKIITDFGNFSSGYSIALQPDGKIVMAGSNNDFVLARYNTNGTLDTSFGSNGKVITPVGSGVDAGFNLAIQANGKIVVTGFAENGTNRDLALVAYNPNGTLDTSFGSNGKVITPVGSGSDGGKGIALQSDNKIVVVGGGGGDFVVTRYEGVSDGIISTPSPTAPTLIDTTVILNSINEDAGIPYGVVGTPLSSLVSLGKNVTDQNSKVTGIAVTATNPYYSGSWYYSTNNGASWSFLNSVSANNARLLAADANTRLYFRPGSDYNGTIADALTFRAWNQTNGFNGGTADTTINGGNTAFSSTTDTASITVISVNDAPVVTPGYSFSIPQNPSNGTIIGAVTATDVDTANTKFSNWAIAAGNLDKDGDGQNAFSINSTNGEIAINDIDDLDPQSNSSINLQVNVSDGTATSANQTVAVKLALKAGDLDPSFGNGGKVITDLGGSSDVAKSAAIQADGKIVVLGYASNNKFALTRYNTNGSLDNNFGSSGKVITSITNSSNYDDNSVVLQADGKILIAGAALNGSNTDFVVARYNADGTTDTSFGTNGQVMTPIGSSSDKSYSIALQSDGKIVTAGYIEYSNSRDYAVVRYNPDGSLDTSFGSGGKVITPVGNSYGYDVCFDIVIQSDGKIVAGGYAFSGSSEDFALVRYNSDGSLDTSFGTGGVILTPIGNHTDRIYSLAIQSDGKIIAAGEANSDFALARYNSNGSLDTSFGSGGKIITALDGFSSIQSIAVLPDGKIVASGEFAHNNYLSSNDFAVVRYNADGSLDNSFGNGGVIITPIGSDADIAYSLALQSDGKVVVVGSSNNNFAVVRYEGLASNIAPSIALSGTNPSYTENAPAIAIASSATVTDFDSANFDMGKLTVSISAGGTADDYLTIRHQGIGEGLIGISGNEVNYNTSLIGTFTGGMGTVPLVITFGEKANAEAIQALMSNITFANVSEHPITNLRSISFVLTDGDGGTSKTVIKNVSVISVNDAPVITSNQSFSVSENTPIGTVVGTVIATDVDSTVLSNWAIASGNLDKDGDGIAAFTINSNSGQITVNDRDELDFESNPSFQLQVTVSDGAIASNAQTVTVNLKDVIENTLNGTPANDKLTGSAANDNINGYEGNDYLYGGAGNDTINGGIGNDYLYGQDGNDIINGGTGNDTLFGGLGDDTIDGGDGFDVLNESADVNFTLTNTQLTGLGTDTLSNIERISLTGGVGNNTIDASAFSLGNVYLYGGAGNDTINGSTAIDYLYGQDGNDILNGHASNDYLYGATGDDTLNGDAGNDYLYGQDGNDIIKGGIGNDNVFGGLGDDTIDGGDGFDVLSESADVNFTLTNTQLTGLGTDTLSNIERITLTGGVGNNTINASAFSLGSLYLYGGAGNDTINGGIGNDYLYGQDGNDIINGGTGNDAMSGGLGDDTIDGGDGFDVLSESADVNFTLTNTQLTGLGTDTLSSIERISLTGGVGNNTIDASAFSLSSVYLYGGAGNDTINGSTSNDYLYGQDGNDIVNGNAGNDILYGGAGNDLLNGDTGNDRLYGELGADTFVLTSGKGTDTIYSFEDGIDKLGLSGGLTYGALTISYTGGSTYIRNTATTEILAILSGINSSAIAENDFTVLNS